MTWIISKVESHRNPGRKVRIKYVLGKSKGIYYIRIDKNIVVQYANADLRYAEYCNTTYHIDFKITEKYTKYYMKYKYRKYILNENTHNRFKQ